MISLTWSSQAVDYPAKAEPEWSSLVERWYQLDTPAFVLTEAFWRVRAQLTARPEWLLLASPGASNLTDHQFATTTAPSPAKFVHTLPNIRSASLLQVMNWSGKVLCLQNDPCTLISALTEAAHLVAEGPVWIGSVTRYKEQFWGHLVTLGGDKPDSVLKIAKNASGTRFESEPHDSDLLRWINERSKDGAAFRAPGFTLTNGASL